VTKYRPLNPIQQTHAIGARWLLFVLGRHLLGFKHRPDSFPFRLLGQANFIVLKALKANITLAGSVPMTVIAIPFQKRKNMLLIFLGTSQVGAKSDD
jgi:hypothetical protein